MAIRVCSVCGIPETFMGKKIVITNFDGKDYCCQHAPRSADPITAEIAPDRIMAPLAENIGFLKKGQDQMLQCLRSIQSSVSFFVVLEIVTILIIAITVCALIFMTGR